MQLFLGLHWPKNDKKWFLEVLGSLLWQGKKLIVFSTFSICRPNQCPYRSDFLYFRELWKISIRAQISFWPRLARFCPIWDMMELKMEPFESRKKIKIFDILEPVFAAETIIAHLILCGILVISNIFDLQNAENRFLLKSPGKAWLHHISEWAKSDRISLIWLKIKSELGLRFFRLIFSKI